MHCDSYRRRMAHLCSPGNGAQRCALCLHSHPFYPCHSQAPGPLHAVLGPNACCLGSRGGSPSCFCAALQCPDAAACGRLKGERGSGRAGTQAQQSQAETAATQRRASEKQKEKGPVDSMRFPAGRVLKLFYGTFHTPLSASLTLIKLQMQGKMEMHQQKETEHRLAPTDCFICSSTCKAQRLPQC